MAFNEVPRGLGRQTDTWGKLSAFRTVFLYYSESIRATNYQLGRKDLRIKIPWEERS